MIPPPFKHRFEGDSGVDIVRQEIDAVFPDGERRRVVLRLGAPYERDGHFLIRSELENLDRTDGPLGGSDLLQALVLGLAWLPARLQVFERRHSCHYFYPDSDDDFDYHELFRPLRTQAEEKAQPGAQHNAGDRPPMNDSPASDTPSSLAQRGLIWITINNS